MSTTFDIRKQMNGIVEAPGKVWFWELAAAVIDADRCVQCGTCVAACPSDSIGIRADGLPMLVKMCTGCSLCWDFCPRAGLRYEATWPGPAGGAPAGNGAVSPRRLAGATPGKTAEKTAEGNGSRPARKAPADRPAGPEDDAGWKIRGGAGQGLGVVREQYSAKVSAPVAGAQDGGVVSALLVAALESGIIDGALVARESPAEPWKGVAHLARTPEEITGAAGSFYNQTMALAHLDLARWKLPPSARIAVVGTPCEVQGLRALLARPFRWGRSRPDAVALTVALLCTKSFDYEGLMLRELRDRRGVDLGELAKVDVIHGRLMAWDTGGRLLVDEPVKQFHGAALKGCDECADFLGRAADVSVGSVGSPDGWSSVLVRTEAGRRALEAARSRLVLADLEAPEALDKLDGLDKRVAAARSPRPLDPDGPLFIDFEEHLRHYEGTDRQPFWGDKPA
jgi:coenzyme F420 hydrogenase subunit beta